MDFVNPELMKMIKDIRSSRMTATTEIKQSLVELRDIRKFFLETDYEEEMKRLERFVNLCKEIRQLKADGTFDSICESALKLSMKGEQK
jgi:negative regulator of replication initiation